MKAKLLSILITGLLVLSHSVDAQYRLYEKGHDSYTAGKFSEAISSFTEYLTKSTRDKSLDPDVYYLLALSHYKTGAFDKAIDNFEEAILLDHPNKGNIYWFKAKCNLNLSQLDPSISDYSKALSLLGSDKPTKAKLLFERGQVYERKGTLESAYRDYQEATVAAPGNADVKKALDNLAKQNLVSRDVMKEQKPLVTKETVRRQEAKEEPKVLVVENTTSQGTAVATVNALAEQYKDERRYALVIGNANYPKAIGALRNPVNDATLMARELEKSNFHVDLLTDATYGQMRAALLKFKEEVDAGERDKTVSLFYYAGHGLQQETENFLVPIDANIEFEDDIPRYCFPVQRMVLANMERSNSRINIVILDACRNNPFPALNRSLGNEGLGEMRRARGSFIAYATAPGSVASDGTGKNGLYTQELVKAMQKPGLTIEQVFKEVRQSVLRQSADRQNTWDSSNIVGDFYFKF